MSEVRLRKVESLLQEEISSMIVRREIKDPGINPLITIAAVQVSRDLKYSRVYVSYFGEAKERERSVQALNRAAGFIQMTMRGRLHLRAIPKLTFLNDDSIEKGFRITQKIKELFP